MIELATAVARATEAVAKAATRSPELQASAAARRASKRLVWALLALDDRPDKARDWLASVVAGRVVELERMGVDPVAVVLAAADALAGVDDDDVGRLRAWAAGR